MEAKELNYPNELPVCEYRDRILDAVRSNPVVIVCGDTGSGKTTQLPKMALELGRAKDGRRIACTQPRRLAAVTMAERVATELKSEIGKLVGFRHRFGRKISSDTRIEFMTDGVLLAETRFDPLLRAYDTIIVDEAHERSLNVDFLLGILKRILEKRKDLKVIVASATLDMDRFSAFFDNAPTINVPGRLFPITISYRPPPEDEERDLPRDISVAVSEIPASDDILVFLPGERDIRDTADYLAKVRGGYDDIIPLLASLPATEQKRAFLPSSRRRIILATNVAETSVTIPGIRAVIDSGLARISRYIHRTQVQRLQVESVSQASARQRSGRCGRIGPGTCIRLYSEDDFLSRDEYTPPEVLRSSLAGVILTMLDLRLGDIERFPFIDPPKPTMIREGLRELLELGAIKRAESGGPELTDIGRKLAKIPIEPRLARIMLAASRNAVLPSVLPIVAAMACDDPRRRPIDEKEKATQAHARFRISGSDLLGTLKLWHWWEDETKDLSQSKARKLCKSSYLSYPKMREWRDLTRQLESLSQKLGLDVSSDNGEDDMIHRSLLTGLLGRIGRYDEEEHDYRGAHGLRFAIHPGSVLARDAKHSKDAKHGLKWIMAGELVDTARLFARNAAVIDPRWLEPIAGPICKHSYHSPEWDSQSGFVRATEQVTLYGLVIVPARRCDYSRVNLEHARELFIRHGLVDCDFPRPPHQIRQNQLLLGSIRKLAEKARHPELFDAERLYEHFAKTIPAEVASADALRKWLRIAKPHELNNFILKREDWWPKENLADRNFPESIKIAGVNLSLSYNHAPDDPESDGITCTVRQSDAAALKLWRSDWLVPGMLPEKLTWMLSTLPTALRRILSPLSDSVTILLSTLKPGSEPLAEAVRHAINKRWGLNVPITAWANTKLPNHLQMRFRIRDDETGRTIAISRNLNEVLTKAGVSSAHACAVTTPQNKSEKSVSWTFGDIPEELSDRNSGWATVSYPALHDDGDGVSLRMHASKESAMIAHNAGVTRLFILALSKATRIPFRRNRISFDAAMYLKELDYDDNRISSDILAGAIAETYVRDRPIIRTENEFMKRLEEDRSQLIKTHSEISSILISSAAMAMEITGLLEDERIGEETADSVSSQLAWLLYRGFPRYVTLSTLRHYQRYLKGIKIRLERARLSPSSDIAKELKFAPYWDRYREAAKPSNAAKFSPSILGEYRWMVEEFRISVFAQELHTPAPISPKRLDAKWEEASLKNITQVGS